MVHRKQPLCSVTRKLVVLAIGSQAVSTPHMRGASIQGILKLNLNRARVTRTRHMIQSPFYRDGAMGGMRDFAGRVARSEPCSEPAADGAAAAS